ncbi:conserved hypothetical protein [Vibrio owensii]|uniref:Type II toxin-antitoxin system HicA family toxin n=1 Tax=Vibrio owensii TaxID=696485 RepID=A0AAU9Q1D8_9VIBR|nr:conserved hypothetical protein [Vibrio owensii]
MFLSELKIEPHLIEAFIKYLKRNGYVVVVSKNKNQPHWISHESTPSVSHITEHDKYGNLKIPPQLHYEAMNFLCAHTTN